MQPAVEFRNISKAFGAVQANADVSFTIDQGSIHGVIGENGAGKSTLMSILYGYYRADSGQLLIDGQARTIRRSGLFGRTSKSFSKLPQRLAMALKSNRPQRFLTRSW